MSYPPTQVIAAWIKEALVDNEWVTLRLVAFSVTSRRLGRSDDGVADYIDEHLGYIAENLRDDLAECAVDGRPEEFEIDSNQPPYIRRRIARQQDILDKLRSIDPFVFEQVCARILSALGAESSVTPNTNDGGIDFIGTKLKVVPSALSMPHSCHGIVVGQAKRHKSGNNVGEAKLREFVGAALLRRHILGVEAALSPLAPTIFAFWTTSDLDPNARRFARSVGLWYMDGVTLASHSEELGLREYVMGL